MLVQRHRMDKNQLRENYKALRKKLTDEQRSEASIHIANRILELPVWTANYFHLFLSSTKHYEVDTEPLLTLLLAKDKQVILPKMKKNSSLDHYLLTDATPIKINAWGIPEPQEGIKVPPSKIDVVFVPLLAYDIRGNRLGYGKGYYDRFLEQCSSECLVVGVSFFEPEERIPFDAKDIPLDYCVTPKKIICFS